MKCQECKAKRLPRLHEDPRDPPIDDEPCLCDDCFRMAAEERIEEHRNSIADLEQRVRRLSA